MDDEGIIQPLPQDSLAFSNEGLHDDLIQPNQHQPSLLQSSDLMKNSDHLRQLITKDTRLPHPARANRVFQSTSQDSLLD
jgi:hypothetical protein